MSRRTNFTLIELLLVMLLVILVGGALTFSFPKLFENQRFERSVSHLQEKLLLAQELMMDYKTDVYVFFEPGPSGVTCQLCPTNKLPVHLDNALNKDNVFSGITSVTPSTLAFLRGGETPSCILSITGKKPLHITLKGFPSKPLKGVYESTLPSPPYPEALLPPS